MKNTLNTLIIALLLVGCANTGKKLPIIGHPTITGHDTLYSTIKPFTFLSQDSAVVTGKTFDNKIYVADFIFLSCIEKLNLSVGFNPVWDSIRSQYDHDALRVGINKEGYITKKLIGIRNKSYLELLIRSISDVFSPS